MVRLSASPLILPPATRAGPSFSRKGEKAYAISRPNAKELVEICNDDKG